MTQTRVWLVDPPKRVTGRRAVPRITRHNGCAQRGTRVTEVLLPLRPILFVDLKGSAAVRGRSSNRVTMRRSFRFSRYRSRSTRKRNYKRPTSAALQAAKARGKRLGNPKLAEARRHSARAKKENANRYSANVVPLIREIQSSGIKSLRGLRAKQDRSAQRSYDRARSNSIAAALVQQNRPQADSCTATK